MENQKGKAEEFFRKAGKKIDNLFSEINNSDFSEKLELKERLAELRRSKDKIEQDFKKFTSENQAFKDITDSFDETFEDIKNVFRTKKNQKG